MQLYASEKACGANPLSEYAKIHVSCLRLAGPARKRNSLGPDPGGSGTERKVRAGHGLCPGESEVL